MIPLAPRLARAQSKQEIRIYGGGELGGSIGQANEGNIDLGASIGVAYAPIRSLSLGIVSAYGLVPSGSCEVLLSGSGGGCPAFHPYRVTAEVEVDPFVRRVVEPFFVADGGVFGQHDTLYGDDPKVAPTFGGGTGLHFFAIDALSVDVALRVLYADFSSYQFGRVWVILSVGATPRVSF